MFQKVENFSNARLAHIKGMLDYHSPANWRASKNKLYILEEKLEIHLNMGGFFEEQRKRVKVEEYNLLHRKILQMYCCHWKQVTAHNKGPPICFKGVLCQILSSNFYPLSAFT